MIRLGAPVLLAVVLASCAQGVSDAPAPTRPQVPDGWTVVEEDHGAVRLALPPDVVAFFTDGSILANEPSPPGKPVWLQVSAMGPGSVEPELQPGQSLRGWLEERMAPEPAGPMSFTPLSLPVGRGTVLRTTIAGGSAEGTLLIWYVIDTGEGIGSLQFLLPPDEEASRMDDIETIAMLLDF